MSYNFPNAPTEGQEYTPPVGGQVYVYRSPRWLVKGLAPDLPGGSGGIDEAPLTGLQYARQSAAWSAVVLPASDWASITGKPTTFAPSAHTHPESEVTNLVADLAAKAPLASPALSGDPTAPTPALADSDTSIATTAFVKGQGYITAAPLDGLAYGRQSGAWVQVVNQSTYAAKMTALDNTNTTVSGQITTLQGQTSDLYATRIADAPNDGSLWGRKNAAWAAIIYPTPDWTTITGKPATFPPTLPIAQSGVTNLVADLALKATLASPTFTGNPLAPTPTAGDNDTSIATTAFVTAAITAALASFISGAAISDTAPGSPAAGTLWWNSTNGNLYIYYNDGSSSQWVQVNTVGT